MGAGVDSLEHSVLSHKILDFLGSAVGTNCNGADPGPQYSIADAAIPAKQAFFVQFIEFNPVFGR